MDRIVPAVERIRVPRAVLPGGTVAASCTPDVKESRSRLGPSRRETIERIFATRSRPSHRLALDEIGIELRFNAPANWSHCVNGHLVLALMLRREIENGNIPGRLTAILPANIPRYIIDLFDLFGFASLATDAPVLGRLCEFEATPHDCIRAVMCELIEEALLDSPVRKAILDEGRPVPKKLFVSRRDTRKLENESEIAALLEARGYTKVYPETLTVLDQFRYFAQATHVVAVHGAGLAPIAYRPKSTPCRLVELLSPGHMTNFYRLITHQTGSRWVGVRGRLWPDVVAKAYTFTAPFKRHSLANFYVDPSSLEVALELAETGDSFD